MTTKGLTTTSIPHGARSFEIEFDFVQHRLDIRTDDGALERIDLKPRSVASFPRRGDGGTRTSCDLPVTINELPSRFLMRSRSVATGRHASYDPEYAQPLLACVVASAIGYSSTSAPASSARSSPVHFFWGGFDLAVTRFSGRSTRRPSGQGVPVCLPR